MSALWLVLVIAGIAACFLSSRALGLGLTLSSFAFAALAMAQAVMSWRTDLVEGRRRLRLFVVGASSLYIGLNAVAQLAGVQRSAPEGASLTGAAGTARHRRHRCLVPVARRPRAVAVRDHG